METTETLLLWQSSAGFLLLRSRQVCSEQSRLLQLSQTGSHTGLLVNALGERLRFVAAVVCGEES